MSTPSSVAGEPAARARAEPVKASLVLGALGVVFGDIGTSPLYTLQECLSGAHGVSAAPANVLGVVSLIVWKSAAVLLLFLSFDIPFFVANTLKFFGGGYLPFMVGVFFVTVMVVWRIGRDTSQNKMGAVSESIFAILSRNAKNATDYFNIPPEQVVELGMQIDL